MYQFPPGPDYTIGSLHARAIADDPARPYLTWYDDGTGERVELSGLTLDNWVAKTANMLVDGCGLGPGSTATVRVRPHWQTAAVLLGCWTAGLSVGPAPEQAATELAATEPADVVFADAPIDSPAADRFLLGLAPMGLPLREVAAGWLDYVVEVRGHGDRYTPVTPVRPADPATLDLTHAALVAAAGERAAALRIPPRGRVLVDADAHPDPLDWLLAPLAAGASIVLCRGLDPADRPARAAAERATPLH